MFFKHHSRLNPCCIVLPGLFILGLLSISGCGGGGGGGGSVVNPIVYTGNTNPAVINTANATTLVASVIGNNAVNVNDIPTAITTTSSSQDTSGYAGPTELVNRLQQTGRQLQASISNNRSAYLATGFTIDEQVPCTDGGYYSISGNLDDVDATGVLDFNYVNCLEDGITTNGTGKFHIDAVDLYYLVFTDSTMEFTRLSMTGGICDLTISGTVQLLLDLYSNVEQTKSNFVYQSISCGYMGKAENYLIETVFDDIFYPTTMSTSISGRLFDSVRGYIDITTPAALDYSDIAVNKPDPGGELQITGAGSAKILMTVLPNDMTSVELDLDNNALYEIYGELPWAVLVVAGSDPNDADGDGLPDSWEQANGLNTGDYSDASQDTDSDGLTNTEEYNLGTDPNDTDTDGDGMPDGWEVDNQFIPTDPADASEDSDGDTASNLEEYLAGTDPHDASSSPSDLSITKTDPIDPASVATNFSYVLAVTNHGPGIALNINVSDTLPITATFVSATGETGEGWVCAHVSGTINCSLASLAVDATSSITVVVTAPASIALLSNTASVSSDTLDLVPANNMSSVTTQLANPILTFVEAQVDDVGLIADALNSKRSVTISPDGKHVYTTRFPDDAISVFSRDSVTGELTFVEIQQDGVGGVDGLDGVNEAAVSGDGAHLYAVSGFDDAIAVFGRNSTTGALTFIESHKDGVSGVTGLRGAGTVTISPDGKNVYVTGMSQDAINDRWSVAVFSRNTSTGMLTFQQVLKDGIDGVEIGWQPKGSISPDGAHFYVATIHEVLSSEGTVTLFSRNATDGTLTYQHTYVDGAEGITGIDGATFITVSQDGNNVYVTGRTTFSSGIGTVVTFSRNATTGELTFVDTLVENNSGTFGIGYASSIEISPGGDIVYITGPGDDTLALFERNATDGTLLLQEVQTDNQNGVDGLDQALSVVASPDGQHVYVTGSYSNTHLDPGDKSVAVFSVTPR